MAEKILIVDDEESMRELLKTFFRGFDYQVVTAETGEEALKILEKDPIPMILLDLNLPGIGGMEVCQRIREKQSDACVYAVTGFHEQYNADKCKEAGFDDFFAKPVSLTIVHNAVLGGFQKLRDK